jgi:rhamnose transport system permease protein
MMQRYRRELSVALAFAGLLAVLAMPSKGPDESSGRPGFFQTNQWQADLVSSAPVLVAAVGMTLVILARHIDISIGSQFSVCGIVAGLLAGRGLPLPVVAGGTLAAGALMGALNGALVAGLRLPSIVVTLATMVILRDSLRWAREGEFVHGLPPGFQWFGAGQEVGQWLVVGVALAVLVAFAWAMRYLAAGRAVYATGSDAEAARLAGIRPRRVVFGVFVLMGVLTGLAGLLNAVRFVDVDPNAGSGLELQVIAAVVVGGTAISGGRGTLVGTLLGVLLLGTLRPALVFLGIGAQWEKVIQGTIILLAVVADALGRKGK